MKKTGIRPSMENVPHRRHGPIIRLYLAIAGYFLILFCLVQALLHLLSIKGLAGHFTFPLAIVVIVGIGLLVVRGVMWGRERAAAVLLPDDEGNIDKKDKTE